MQQLCSGDRLGGFRLFSLEKSRSESHIQCLKGLQKSWRRTLDKGLK